MNKRIWLSSPHMSGEEMKFVQEAFETNWVAPVGPHINAFERELAVCAGTGHCAALSSGTAAIHLALIILGVKAGDEVICSSFTFSGSCNPIIYQGATPVFVDSEPETMNMDPALLQEAIDHRLRVTGRTPKAIILVHLYGMPAKMAEIQKIAEKFDIPIVEDAAEALGSTYRGRSAGSLGALGVFSFNGNKIITTSGGGALMSDNGEWIEEARFLASQARDPAPHYEHSRLGFNYRMSNICAGIGRGQLVALDERVRRRRDIFAFYQRELGNRTGFRFCPEPEGSFSNRWLTTIVLDPSVNPLLTPENVRLGLERENIESRPLWKPMHLQPFFRDFPSFVTGTSEKLFLNGLCLPSGSNLSEEDLLRVVETVDKVTNSPGKG